MMSVILALLIWAAAWVLNSRLANGAMAQSQSVGIAVPLILVPRS